MDDPSAKQEDSEAQHKIMQTRMQALLADRFKLRVHKEVRQLAIYDLTVAKDGPKLTKSTEENGTTTGPDRIKCSAASASNLAYILTGTLNHIVIDRTGLTGKYAFTLKWNPVGAPGEDVNLPDLFTAIQEQLGLKLVRAKGPVEVLLVDSAEKSSEN